MQATRLSFAMMQVPGEQRDTAQAQPRGSQPAGFASQENCASGQPAMQPGGPASEQLGVAVLPGGQMPPSGIGLQVREPQCCLPTHSSLTGQTASPQVVGPPSPASDDDLQPARTSSA